jgi:NAD(P)-dependent dehydrogenase (short-subunit alcohol dehydrogenase family)
VATATAVIIGAGGGIGSALFNRWQTDPQIKNVIGVSRHPVPNDSHVSKKNSDWLVCDYSENAIETCCENIRQQVTEISRLCICNGILHADGIWPEKRIEDLDPHTLQQVFTVNTLIPMTWLRSLLPMLHGSHHCVVTVFNARIGSIGDNHLGGWYSYRASKAALNMLLKTAAIEFARRAKNVKLISFHPGTTDTGLSKPFQQSVEKQNLLTPDYVADHLVEIMNSAHADGELSYVDWENKPIIW